MKQKRRETAFERRRRRVRHKMAGLNKKNHARLSIHRSNAQIYVQIIDDVQGKTLAAASTNEPAIRDEISGKGANRAAAQTVGKAIAERAKKAGISDVMFDRGGFLYHGRVKALADAAREGGLKF